jgi:hypothetical protein
MKRDERGVVTFSTSDEGEKRGRERAVGLTMLRGCLSSRGYNSHPTLNPELHLRASRSHGPYRPVYADVPPVD